MMDQWLYSRVMRGALPKGSELTSIASAVSAMLYPTGLLTSGVSSTEEGTQHMATVPASASTVVRYTVLQNGGYEPGGSPMYSWLLRPAAPKDSLVVFYHGHDALPWDTHYSQLAEWILADGHNCLFVELPQFGYNPNGGHIIYGGVEQQVTQHGYSAFFDAITPDAFRLFLDTPLRSINEALGTLGLDHVSMMALSGGGICSAVLQTVDARIHNRYSFAGFWPVRYTAVGLRGDWEYLFCPRLRATCGHEVFVGEIMEWCSALGARHAVNVFLTADDQATRGRQWMVDSWVEEANIRLSGVANGGIEGWIDNAATGHEVSSWAMAQALADINAREA